MKRLILVLLATLVTSCLLSTAISADVPYLIRYQGKVTDKQGVPLNGAYNITFRIYDSASGGTLLWSETQASTPVNNGIFTVLLGNVNAFNLPFNKPYWMTMEVSEDGEMLPRQAITSSAYALYAEKAKTIDGVSVVPSGAIILWRGDSCPVGYHRVTEMDGKFLVSSATYNPAAGGNNTHNHGGVTGSHTLTIAEMPAHDHAETAVQDTGVGPQSWIYEHESDGSTVIGTRSHASQGGGQGHTHPISTADNRPEFATVILCEKD